MAHEPHMPQLGETSIVMALGFLHDSSSLVIQIQYVSRNLSDEHQEGQADLNTWEKKMLNRCVFDEFSSRSRT